MEIPDTSHIMVVYTWLGQALSSWITVMITGGIFTTLSIISISITIILGLMNLIIIIPKLKETWRKIFKKK